MPTVMGFALQEKLREAIKEELRQERYAPSAGQTKGHVDDRVSRAVMEALGPFLTDLNEGLIRAESEVKLITDQRDEVRARLHAIDYLIDLVMEGSYGHSLEDFAQELRRARSAGEARRAAQESGGRQSTELP